MNDTTKPAAENAEPTAQAPAAEAAATARAAQPAPSTALDRELAETKDRLLRTLADMENLRRRTEREVADARTYGITAFARDILSVGDNMHRALEALDKEIRDNANDSVKGLLDGVELTERALLSALEKHGVKKIEPMGQKFDPNKHQAMYEVEDASVPSGQVVQVVQAGYLIGERVLRPALVAVSKGGPKAPPANDNPAATPNAG